ncbi:hypothetical protein D3C76_1093940 [compost metagenome]
MCQVVTHGLRLNAVALHPVVGVLHQLLAGDVLIFELTQPGFADSLEGGALGLAQWPEFFILPEVALDHFLDRHALTVGLGNRARFGHFRLAPLDPGLSRGLTVERLAFLINCHTLLHDADLRGVRCRTILALANSD